MAYIYIKLLLYAAHAWLMSWGKRRLQYIGTDYFCTSYDLISYHLKIYTLLHIVITVPSFLYDKKSYNLTLWGKHRLQYRGINYFYFSYDHFISYHLKDTRIIAIHLLFYHLKDIRIISVITIPYDRKFIYTYICFSRIIKNHNLFLLYLQ